MKANGTVPFLVPLNELPNGLVNTVLVLANEDATFDVCLKKKTKTKIKITIITTTTTTNPHVILERKKKRER